MSFPTTQAGRLLPQPQNKAIDRFGTESSRRRPQLDAAHLERGEIIIPPGLVNLKVVADDQLRFIFLCYHPDLGVDVQVASILRLLGGPETPRAFLVPEATLAQRLVHAKHKIRDTHMSFQFPTASDLPGRFPSVLGAIYRIFNEGHTASEEDHPVGSSSIGFFA